MNLALLAKQAWRIYMNPDALWVQFLKSIYFPNEDFLRVRKKGRVSWIWDNILKERDILRKGGMWIVGDGNSNQVWRDNWLLKELPQNPSN